MKKYKRWNEFSDNNPKRCEFCDVNKIAKLCKERERKEIKDDSEFILVLRHCPVCGRKLTKT